MNKGSPLADFLEKVLADHRPESCVCTNPDEHPCLALRDPGDGHPGEYTCTRPEGHEGDHVACGVFPYEHPLHVWAEDSQ